MVYKRDYIVNEFLTKKDRLTVANITNYFIETSNYESKLLNLDNKKLNSLGYTWMAYQWRISIDRHPRAYENISISTWASGFKSLKAFREFEIKSKEVTIARASIEFVLIDLKNRKAIRIPEEIYGLYKPTEKKFFEKIKRINIKKDINFINTFSYNIINRDIDENNHVNNSVYIDLLEDAMHRSFKDFMIFDLSIQYMREIKLYDEVFIDLYSYDNKIYFKFRNKENNLEYARAWVEYPC